VLASSPFQVAKPKREALRQQWHELAALFTSDVARCDEILRQLFGLYAETHRAYHNLSHISTLLFLADDPEFSSQWREFSSVAFAVWFHDAVYQPRNHDNEERSAAFAVSALTVPAEVIGRVRAMILATRKHTAENLDEDGKMFLDLDLSILGALPETYRAYREAIRAEYSWVPGFLYRRARRQLLQGFIERERLYFSASAYQQFEAPARANLAQELQEL
jgi:predicted metal-dependent HD superfamily phosphohydrolase